jgi:hypothetical protein
MWHTWGRSEIHTKFWLESLKGKDHHLEDLSIDERIILKWILRKQCERVWTGFIRLRRGTIGGLL